MSVDLTKARIMNVMRNLPPMPAVTQQLLRVMQDDNSSAVDVTKVLSSDQALAGKVLKLVNSSFYGVSSEVTTISRAVVMLGFTGIRNLALGFGSVEALSRLGSQMDVGAFWAHSMANAVAAQSLAPFLNRRTDPEEAFIAGLMHDIGSYVLAAAVPEVYGEILADTEGDLLAREAAEIGMTHAQVGQGLLKFWALPEPFCEAARYHHDLTTATAGEQPLTALVALADILACVHGGSLERPASESDLARLLGATGVSIDNVRLALETMDQKIQDMESFLRIAGASVGALNTPAGPVRTCVVITQDDDRRQWVEGLVAHFGLQRFGMEAFFNQAPGSAEVGLALVDPQSLTRQQLERLLTFLSGQSASVAILSDTAEALPEPVRALPRLSFVFSGRDLQRVCDHQPA